MNSLASTNKAIERRILIMAGGTGGHIFPAVAVAEELSSQGWDIHWLGTADRMEAQVVPKQGYKLHLIQVSGLRGKGLVAKLKSGFALLKAIWDSKKLIKEITFEKKVLNSLELQIKSRIFLSRPSNSFKCEIQ